MKNKASLFLLIFSSALMTVLVSCSKDNAPNGSSSKEFSSLLGEWSRTKSEYYKKDGTLARTYTGKGTVSWVFKPSGEYQDSYYTVGSTQSEGSFKVKKDKLYTYMTYLWKGRTEKETDNDVYDILELTDDTMVVKSIYEDTEYDYEIDYFKKLRSYDPNLKLSEEAKKIVGTWSLSNAGDYDCWRFSEDGIVYVDEDDEVGPFQYYRAGEWHYDDQTRSLITTLTYEIMFNRENYTYGNFTYAWTLLNISDTSMSGQQKFAKEAVTTFRRIGQ